MFDTKSTFFENIHIHRFLADILSDCALRESPLFLDVIRFEVDDGGIDLVLSSGKQKRYIQLKARAETINKKPYLINNRLLEIVGGAVIWIRYSKKTLAQLDYFALVGILEQRILDIPSFNPATNKGKPRKGFSFVRMRQANHQELSVSELARILFP